MKWIFEPCKENFLLSVNLIGQATPDCASRLKEKILEEVEAENYLGVVFCGRLLDTSDTFAPELRKLAQGFEQIVRTIQPLSVGLFPASSSQYGMARQLSFFVTEECPEFGIFRDETEIGPFFLRSALNSNGNAKHVSKAPTGLGEDCCETEPLAAEKALAY